MAQINSYSILLLYFATVVKQISFFSFRSDGCYGMSRYYSTITLLHNVKRCVSAKRTSRLSKMPYDLVFQKKNVLEQLNK